MRVFAPTAFTYQNVSYPYGWQEIEREATFSTLMKLLLVFPDERLPLVSYKNDPVTGGISLSAFAQEVDSLGRIITYSRGNSIDSMSYKANGNQARKSSTGKNYRLDSGTLLVNATTAPTSTANTNSTVDTNATSMTRSIFTNGVKVTTGTTANDRGSADWNNLTSIPTLSNSDYILIPVYVHQCNSTDTVIAFISPNNQASTSINATFALNSNKLGWFFIYVPLSVLTGTATVSDAMNSIRLQVKHVNGGGVATIVTVFGAILNPHNAGKIMLDFDDGFLSVYTTAYPYMKARNLVGNVGVIASAVGQSAGGLDAFDYMTLAQLQTLYADGWGMLTHGYYAHNGAPLSSSESAITADIATNKNYLAANGLTGNQQHYVYPAGITLYPASINALTANGMVTGRGTLNNLIQTGFDGPDDKTELFSLAMNATTGITALQTAVDRVVGGGGTYIFYGHRVVTSPSDSSTEISTADFQTLMAYIATQRDNGLLDVVTRQQWYAGLA